MIATFPYTYTYTNNEEALTPPPSGERSVDHLCRHCGQPTDDASPPGSIRDLPFLSDAWVIRASRQLNYRIQEATNLFSPSNETLVHHIPSIEGVKRRALVVIDESVQRLHGDDISSYFDYHGIELLQVPIVSQEVNKNIDNVLWISRAMHDFGLSRRTEPLIGIGGGVLLDIIGLAASLYRRGVPYIRVPTTLMGLIDAGIGIKTGVNFDRHKNRLGTYYAPVAGYLDRSFLRTLDERHMSNGLAEILKMALIKDGRLFELHPREGRRRWALEQGLVAADRLLPAGDGALARVLEDTGGLGVDAAILCTPRTASLDALRTALQLIRAEGCIDLFGGVPSGSPLAELPDVDLASIRRGNSCGAPSPGCHARTQTRAGRPIVLTGHRGAASRHIHAATALLQQHPQLFGKLITHVVSVDAAASMLRLHAESGARRYVDQEWVKVAIDFRRGGYSIEVSPHKPTKTAAGWRDV
jgi:hypothetical protein